MTHRTDSQLNTKQCGGCGLTKPVGAFNRDGNRGDGLDTRCRECRAAWRADNRQLKAQIDRRWNDRNREHVRARQRTWRRRNSGRRAEYERRYRAHARDVALAHSRVTEAVRTGRLPHISTQFCFCGLDGCAVTADHYHHVDYSQSLTVIPVCASCHARWHAAVGTVHGRC